MYDKYNKKVISIINSNLELLDINFSDFICKCYDDYDDTALSLNLSTAFHDQLFHFLVSELLDGDCEEFYKLLHDDCEIWPFEDIDAYNSLCNQYGNRYDWPQPYSFIFETVRNSLAKDADDIYLDWGNVFCKNTKIWPFAHLMARFGYDYSLIPDEFNHTISLGAPIIQTYENSPKAREYFIATKKGLLGNIFSNYKTKGSVISCESVTDDGCLTDIVTTSPKEEVDWVPINLLKSLGVYEASLRIPVIHKSILDHYRMK